MSSTGAQATKTDDDRLAALERRVSQLEQEKDELEDELESERDRRRQLERVVAENDRERVSMRKSNVTQTTLNHLVQALTGAEISDYSSDPMQNRSAVDHVGDQIQDLKNTVARHDSIIEEQGTASGNSKDKKWQDTVEAAKNLQNKADHSIGDGWVKLFTENIEQATGCSNRRAGQLIDEWSDEKQGTDMVPYERITTSRKTDGSNVQRKALKVDLDVWGED